MAPRPGDRDGYGGYPSYADLHNKLPEHYPKIFQAAPWFCPLGVKDMGFLQDWYADDAGFLPGGVSLAAVRSADWRRRLAISPTSCRRERSESVASAHNRFFQAVLRRLALSTSQFPIPPGYRFDTWEYRTPMEREYGYHLARFGGPDRYPSEEADARWRGYFAVSQDAIFWTSSVLRLDFRFIKRCCLPFYKTTVRYERRIRSATGHLIPYQMIEAAEVAAAQYRSRYVPIPTHFARVEVCQGMWVEMGPVMTYLGLSLLDPYHGLWCVFYTEWAIQVSAFLLWDVYDTWRLWYIPPKLREYILDLDLTVPLGDAATAEELQGLVRVIAAIDWDNVSRENSTRPLRPSGRRPNVSPGRNNPNHGDWVWYDPWAGSFCSQETAKASRHQARVSPTSFYQGGPEEGVPYVPEEREGALTQQGAAEDLGRGNTAAEVGYIDEGDEVRPDTPFAPVSLGSYKSPEAGSPTLGSPSSGDPSRSVEESEAIRVLLRSFGWASAEKEVPLAEVRLAMKQATDAFRKGRQLGIQKSQILRTHGSRGTGDHA